MPNTTTTAQSLFLCMDGVLRRVGVGGGDYYSCYDEKNAMVSLVMEKDEDYHVLLLYCGWFPSETERERGGGGRVAFMARALSYIGTRGITS